MQVFYFIFLFTSFSLSMQKSVILQDIRFDKNGLADVSNKIIKTKEAFMLIVENKDNKCDMVYPIYSCDSVEFEDYCFLRKKTDIEPISKETKGFSLIRSILISQCFVESFVFCSVLKNRTIKIRDSKKHVIKAIIF